VIWVLYERDLSDTGPSQRLSAEKHSLVAGERRHLSGVSVVCDEGRIAAVCLLRGCNGCTGSAYCLLFSGDEGDLSRGIAKKAALG
jgi:hypothetical protein